MVHDVVIDGPALTTGQVEAVSRGPAKVKIGDGARARLAGSRSVVEQCLTDGRAHYGVNTGFGSLSRQRIGEADLRTLQQNLLRSHAAGVGEPLARETVRGMMLLLAASLVRGHSGVRPVLAERLVDMLNHGITPVVPEVGSVGASGDLAPLAHIALVLTGEGEAWLDGTAPASEPSVLRGSEGVGRAGLQPVTLEAREGLALINGTHLMAARGALLMQDFQRLFDAALLAAAMSIDACRATDAFLDERVYQARNQAGPGMVAARLRTLLAGSEIVTSHKDGDPRVQDPYSLRCAPVVLGAAWDAADYVKRAVEAELGAVTDNPLVFADVSDGRDRSGNTGAIISAGNFHGMPVAIPLDVLSIALSHIAGIAERRIYYMLSATDPQNPIPAYLSPHPGLHSGLMITQYTAAACCNEIIGLAMPASVANIPTSAGIEDYNSFGPRSAAKAARTMELTRQVVAIELLCAAEGLEHQRPLRSGRSIETLHQRMRTLVPRLTADRPPAPDIAALVDMIQRGDLGPRS
jgi:histidine ammonia-lyase